MVHNLKHQKSLFLVYCYIIFCFKTSEFGELNWSFSAEEEASFSVWICWSHGANRTGQKSKRVSLFKVQNLTRTFWNYKQLWTKQVVTLLHVYDFVWVQELAFCKSSVAVNWTCKNIHLELCYWYFFFKYWKQIKIITYFVIPNIIPVLPTWLIILKLRLDSEKIYYD